MGRILLVDDDPSVLFALSEVLASYGHDVVTASGGAEGLARMDGATPFDLLVTDLAMPGMNGLELLEKARGRDTTLPVIVVTAHGSERTAADAMKRGATDYIAKPFDNDAIECSIERALETRAAGAGS